MRVEADSQSIEELLTNNYFFIPRFQRPYSWELDHVQEFWDDINQNIGSAYFIGSMVMYEANRGTLAVVDGQQRLTTITILMCAIRDAFWQLGATDLAAGLQNFIERTNRDNERIFVLQTESSFPFLQEEVLRAEPAEIAVEVGREEEAIKRAADRFAEQIKEKISALPAEPDQDGEDPCIEWLKSLRDTVLDLTIIKVELEKEEDAYLIFETLNTRGKDLALSDLVKNHFSKLLPAKGQIDAAVIRWNNLLSTIGESREELNPDTFITHFWQSRYDFLTKAKVFPKLKKDVKKSNAKDFLSAFEKDAAYWRAIFEFDYGWNKKEKDIQRSLQALRMFRVVQPTPGLLSLIRAYKGGTIRQGTLVKALRYIEYFHFAFTAVTSSRSSGGISGMYASFGRKLFEATDSNVASAEIQSLRSKLQERLPTELEFDAGFEQIHFTRNRTAQKPLVRYILQAVSAHEKQPTIGPSDDLTIEHLVPQSEIGGDISDEEVGQIGNLMLIDQSTNSKIGNKPFVEKKLILEEAGYRVPELLASADNLNAGLLRKNTARVAEIARSTVWKV